MRPKSIAEHKAAGTYRRDRHGDRLEAAPTSVAMPLPAKPHNLPAAGAKLWDDVTQTMPTALWATDAATLETACRLWAKLQSLLARVASDESDDEYKLLVKLAIVAKAFSTVANKLGLNPVDRCRLRNSAPAGERIANPLEELRRAKVS